MKCQANRCFCVCFVPTEYRACVEKGKNARPLRSWSRVVSNSHHHLTNTVKELYSICCCYRATQEKKQYLFRYLWQDIFKLIWESKARVADLSKLQCDRLMWSKLVVWCCYDSTARVFLLILIWVPATVVFLCVSVCHCCVFLGGFYLRTFT